MDTSPTHLNTLIAHVLRTHPGDDPLARVEAACQTAADLDEVADHLVGHFVDEARAAGYTWTQIGEHIGVTKQAARKRFAPRDVPERTPGAAARSDVFGRYTGPARHVVVLAQENARKCGHPLINTEHLLLGICQEDGDIGAKVIEASGASVAGVRTAVTARLAPASAKLKGHIPFANQGKKALELTTRASLLLGHDEIGTGHLLLGLIDEGTGLAAEVLTEAGVTADRAREEFVRLLDS